MRPLKPPETRASIGDESAAPARRGWREQLLRRRTIALALIVLVVGVYGGWAYGQAHGVESAVLASVHSATTHLEKGKQDLKAANQKHDAALLDAAQKQLRAGIDDFRHAAAIADGNRFAQTAAGVPLVGAPIRSRLDAVDALSTMGVALSQAALKAADVDRLFITPTQGAAESGAAKVLGILKAAAPIMPEVQRLLDQAQAAAGRIDPGLLTSSQRALFASVRTTIATGLSGVEEFNRLAPVIQDVLGANGPRTYLVEQANPFELRAGGGYIGTYSLIRADAGKLTVLESGDTHDLPEFQVQKGAWDYVAPPPPLDEFLDNNSWNLGDSNFFPTFQLNAQAALNTFGERDFGQKIDGVVSLDLYAVRAILQLTGPIQVQGSPTKLDAQNLFSTLIQLDITDTQHKEVLGALAGPLMSKVTSLGADSWPRLLDVLNQQATQRHIQAYFTNQTTQDEFGRLGWSGGLAWDKASDFMYPLESNFGGNKANYYLTRRYTLNLTRSGSTLHHELQVDYSLDLSKAPPKYTDKWAYRAYLRMFVPSTATNVAMHGVKGDDDPYTNDPPGAIPSGTKMSDGWQQINPGRTSRKGTMQITITWDTPWTADAAGAHKIYWQAQPGTSGDKVLVHWNDGTTSTSTAGALNTDLILTLTPGHAAFTLGHQAQAKIPRLSF